MPRIAALILAAGSSSRMGHPKQFLQFENESLLRRIATIAITAACAPVRVVIGAFSELMRKELASLDVDIIENPDWPKGMGTSIRAGMTSFPESADALLILLCDQPLITADHLRSLIDQFERSEKPLCACSYPDGSIGTPAIFNRTFFPHLRALPDAAGAKKILMEHIGQIAAFPLPQAAIDLDTPADVEAFKKRTTNEHE